MSEPGRSAVVIGAGVGGLVAAAYLARAGVATTVLEARDIVGGSVETAMLGTSFRVPLAAHAFYALDRRMARELRLYREGVEFAERDMMLVALRQGGNHLVLPRGALASRAAIKAHAPSDLDAYLRYRRELFAFARAMRALWLGEHQAEEIPGDLIAAAERICILTPANRRRLEMFVRASAGAWLDRMFESDALKAALAFDVALHGVSPQEAGSALLLAWHAAQEMGGMQGAVAQFKGGPLALAATLTRAAQDAGATVRTGAPVTAIAAEGARTTGVTVAGSERIEAGVVLSNLGRAETMALLPPEAAGFGMAEPGSNHRIGCAKVLLGLDGPVPVAGLAAGAERGRLIVAGGPEVAAEAKGAALIGRMPDELVLEITIPSAADASAAPAGSHVVSVCVPYMPVHVDEGWERARSILLRRVIMALESYAPGLSERIVERVALTPEDLAHRYGSATAPPSAGRLLATFGARIRMPAQGLYLCGSAAEPADAASGAAGRVAAAMALGHLGIAKDAKR
jgi:phytoene dehydrogenase-like protein